jgi:uncharacterized protein YcaQ
MHYRGLLRVARRDGGKRCYAAREIHDAASDPAAALDAMVDVVVAKYAPLPAASLVRLVAHLALAAPQWRDGRKAALLRARSRLAHARADGIDWFWPAGENPRLKRHAARDELRLLAPFDPVVWDRLRFEIFWGWAYRFEAYTPAPKRVRGYYALPLLWRDRVIGWANLALRDGSLLVDVGHVGGQPPRQAAYRRALDDELQRMQLFLGV